MGPGCFRMAIPNADGPSAVELHTGCWLQGKMGRARLLDDLGGARTPEIDHRRPAAYPHPRGLSSLRHPMMLRGGGWAGFGFPKGLLPLALQLKT